MAISNQIKTLKENWLIVLGIIVVIFALNSFGVSDISRLYNPSSVGLAEKGYIDSSVSSYNGFGGGDFAPEVSDRKIVKSVSASFEIERGDFEKASASLKEYVSEADGILLDENVNSYGEGLSKMKTGYYSIRLIESEYSSFISKVKELGEVESFNENARDITGNYLTLEDNIKLEKERLERYKELLVTAKSTDEKISLTDRIFEQEKTIKLLEDSLKRQDQRIEYVTVYLTLNEEQSDFINISLIGIGELAKSFVNSLNSVVILIFLVIPWLVLIFILRAVWRYFKR